MKKVSLKIDPRSDQQGEKRRLDQILAELLPEALGQPLSKGKVRKLIVAGAVYLNGKRVRIASKEILPKARIEVYIDLEKLNSGSKATESAFEMSNEQILFEDDYLIVVNKPAGLPTQPTLDEARNNLFEAVKKFCAKRAGIPLSNVYLGLHHRLDRDTSGVILFTKLPQANPGIAEAFSSHGVEKTYQALSYWDRSKQPDSTWTVKNYLGRSHHRGKKAKFASVRSGGDFAQTDFSVIETLQHSLWIEAKPRTGRTHQIRVHLSEEGMPILGDEFYGGPKQIRNLIIPRIMLHAINLTFPHPIHKNKVSVHCSLPGDFNQCLKALQKFQGGSSSS